MAAKTSSASGSLLELVLIVAVAARAVQHGVAKRLVDEAERPAGKAHQEVVGGAVALEGHRPALQRQPAEAVGHEHQRRLERAAHERRVGERDRGVQGKLIERRLHLRGERVRLHRRHVEPLHDGGGCDSEMAYEKLGWRRASASSSVASPTAVPVPCPSKYATVSIPKPDASGHW